MKTPKLDDTDLDELLALRSVCAEQVAAGLDAHSLAAILRQLVQVSASIDDRTPPSDETFVDWMLRRRAAMRSEHFDDDAAAEAFLTDWRAANPEPPKPIRRGTPEPITEQPEEAVPDA